ncbi:hypothetical protein D0A41_22235 [Xanthomonas campestris]|nr:hypothetical protein D0A41_22235 [Xanthomonas campestris]
MTGELGRSHGLAARIKNTGHCVISLAATAKILARCWQVSVNESNTLSLFLVENHRVADTMPLLVFAHVAIFLLIFGRVTSASLFIVGCA